MCMCVHCHVIFWLVKGIPVFVIMALFREALGLCLRHLDTLLMDPLERQGADHAHFPARTFRASGCQNKPASGEKRVVVMGMQQLPRQPRERQLPRKKLQVLSFSRHFRATADATNMTDTADTTDTTPTDTNNDMDSTELIKAIRLNSLVSSV